MLTGIKTSNIKNDVIIKKIMFSKTDDRITNFLKI